MSMLRELFILHEEEGEGMLGIEYFWITSRTISIVPGMVNFSGEEKDFDISIFNFL